MGATGSTGPQGIQGIQGVAGPAGAAGTSLSIATIYVRTSLNTIAVQNGTAGDKQWCDAGDIAIGGYCNIIVDATHTTYFRGAGTIMDVPNNKMGFSCLGYSPTTTGALTASVICAPH
jgi:hypothetical protein